MARITWQNVGQPDFSTALRGYQSFSDTLNNALGAADRGLTRFDNSVSERVNKAFMADVLATENPDEAKALMQGMRGRDDFNRISLASMGAADGRSGVLNQRAAQEEALGDTRYNRERSRAKDARLEAAGPLIKAATLAANTGDMEAYNTNMQALAESGMFGDEYLNASRDISSVRNNEQTWRKGEQDIAFGADRHQWAGESHAWDGDDRRDRKQREADALEGETLFNRAAELYGNDPFMLRMYIGGSSASDYVKNAALRGVGMSGSGGSGGGSGGYSGGGAGGGFTYNADRQTVASALSKGGMPDVMVAASLGNFEVEGGWDGALGDNGTASGIAQLRGPRREAFKRMYGVEPHKGTKQQQAEYTLWELTTAEGRKVSGISKANADKIMNFKGSPEEAAELFMNVYERPNKDPKINHIARRKAAAIAAHNTIFGPNTTTPRSTEKQNAALKDRLNIDASKDSTAFTQRVAELSGSNLTPKAVIKAAVGKDGIFEGMNENVLSRELTNVMKKAGGINAEQALLLIEASMDPATKMNNIINDALSPSGDMGMVGNFLLGPSNSIKNAIRSVVPSGNWQINRDTLNSHINDYKVGSATDSLVRGRQRAEDAKDVTELQAQKVQINDVLNQRKRALSMGHLNERQLTSLIENIRQLEAQMNQIDVAMGAIGDSTNSSGGRNIPNQVGATASISAAARSNPNTWTNPGNSLLARPFTPKAKSQPIQDASRPRDASTWLANPDSMLLRR